MPQVVDQHKFEDADLYYRMCADDPAPGGDTERLPVAELLTTRDHVLAGWFFKQGHVFLNRRYFVLDGDNRRLYVYTNDVAGEPRYFVALQRGCRLRASIPVPPPSNTAPAPAPAAPPAEADDAGGVLLRGWGAPPSPSKPTAVAATPAAVIPTAVPGSPSGDKALHGTMAAGGRAAAPPKPPAPPGGSGRGGAAQADAAHPPSVPSVAGGGGGAEAGGATGAQAHSVWSEGEDSSDPDDVADPDTHEFDQGARGHMVHIMSPEAEIFACVLRVACLCRLGRFGRVPRGSRRWRAGCAWLPLLCRYAFTPGQQRRWVRALVDVIHNVPLVRDARVACR